MRERTNDVNYVHYNYYGGRGINSDAFENFVDFYDAMYDSYLEAIEKYGNDVKISLDRINPNGNYCQENCRWIPLRDQNKNKRNNRWFLAIDKDGNEYVACNRSNFASLHNIKRATINSSLLYGYKNKQGWTFRFLTEEEIEKLDLKDRLEYLDV